MMLPGTYLTNHLMDYRVETALRSLSNDNDALEKNTIESFEKGTTFYVGGGGSGNYSSIQDAIDAASDGDVIFVYSGTYTENILIDISLEITGQDRDTTIIDGGGLDETVTITASDVNLSAFTIRNGNDYGILLDACKRCTLGFLLVTGNTHSGIYGRSIANCSISNSLFTTNDYGIYLDFSSKNSIVTDNILTDNELRGIFIKSCTNISATANEITSSSAGIALYYSSQCEITHNIVNDNDDGIRIKNADFNTIGYNDFSFNDDGIYIFENSLYNIIVGNTIQENTYHSIHIDRILSASNYNRIYHNNFIQGSTSQFASDDCITLWNNYTHAIKGGNYWSDFDEPSEGAWDNNSDTIIDTPYNITGGTNQDRYPLQLPWIQYLPTANFSWIPQYPVTSKPVRFQDNSNDSYYGSIVSWSWDFDYGTTSKEQNPSHQYPDNGTYTVRLTVTDDDGDTDTVEHLILVGNMAPVAEFSWDPVSPTTADVIQYIDFSTDSDGIIVSWDWDFGDGIGSSTLQHPTYQYADNGSYLVRLTVTDDDGVPDTKEHLVSVANVPPIVNFTWYPEVPSTADTIQFIDLSTDIDGTLVTWKWDFGDGNGISAQRHPQYSYANDGSYSVQLSVTDNDGATSSFIKQINITNVPPIANFTWLPPLPTTADTIHFYDLSNDADGVITNYSWDFGDGIGNSTEQHPIYQYAAKGTYQVVLTILDDDGAEDTCEYPINVSNAPPFAMNDSVEILENHSISINVTGNDYDVDGTIDPTTVTIITDVTNGTTTIDPLTGNITYTPIMGFTGIDYCTYTIDDNEGATSNEATVTIMIVDVKPPEVDFSFEPLTPSTADIIQFTDLSIDDGEIVAWFWDFGDGIGSSTEQHPTYSYSDDGTYTVRLTVTDDQDGIAWVEQPITVTNVPPVALDDTGITIEDTSIDINVTVNDYDTDGTLVLSTVTIQSNVSHGTILVSPTGIVTYTPDTGYNGGDQFTYSIDDDDGATSNIATVTITVVIGGEWEDIVQEQSGYNFFIFGSRWAAQSFKPTSENLTRIDLLIGKRGTPPEDLIVSVRSALSGSDLVTYAIPEDYVPTVPGWVGCNIPDVQLTAYQTYYIVLHTGGTSNINSYQWSFGANTPYTDGALHYSSTSGVTWSQYSMYDFCFRTYGTQPVPLLAYTPSSHDFGSMMAGETQSTVFDIWNSGTGVLSYTLSEVCGWVSVSPLAGDSMGEHDEIQVTIDTTGLSSGFHQCTIDISSNGGTGTFTVAVTIETPIPVLNYTPVYYDFGTMTIGETNTTMFDIWNSGTGVLSYTLSESCGWVSVSPLSGDSAGEHDTITVAVDTASLSAGFHQCTIDISSNGGTGSFTVNVTVVEPIPLLAYQPNSYDFGELFDNQTASTTFYLWNNGNGILTYSLTSSCTFVTVSPSSGSSTTEADTITVTVNTTNVAEGDYQCTITISSNGGSGVFTVDVTVIQTDAVLTYTPSSYDFGPMFEGELDITTFDIWNNGTGILSYTLNESYDWIWVSPLQGSSTGEHDSIQIIIDTTGLSDGSYHGDIQITSNGGTGLFGIDVEIAGIVETPDQQQTQDGYAFTIFGSRWAAQSFVPTRVNLSRVDLLLSCKNVPPSPLTISLRQFLNGNDLVSFSLPASEVSSTAEWISCDIPDINVTPGVTYFLVLHTVNGDNNAHYKWHFGSNTPYTDGTLLFSSSNGASWTQYSYYDFCFKTYGIGAPSVQSLSFAPVSYDFGDMMEDSLASTTFEIWNSGTGSLIYTLSSSNSWITIEPETGISSGEHDLITVTVNTTGLSLGYHESTVLINSNGGQGNVTFSVTVIELTPVLSYSPTSHDFGALEQGQTSSTLFEIWNSGQELLVYTLSENCSWATVTPLTGTSTGEHDIITVSVDTTSLSQGMYHCDISINSNGGQGLFTINLEVLGSGGGTLDQQQTKQDYNFVIFGERWAAQSFKPILGSLTSLQLLMGAQSEPSDLEISLRSSLTGTDLTAVSLPYSSFPMTPGWVTIDVPDITVTPGETYYIVVHTDAGSIDSCYLWGFGGATDYTRGTLHFSNTGGALWTDYAFYDFCFKTYG